MEPEKIKELFFPHESVRKVQDELIKDVEQCISNKKQLIAHAPTGLGKTASAIPVALSYALKNNLAVFFLTNRHTQHIIALETLKQIKEKYKTEFISVDLIGKKYMCPVPNADKMYSNEFTEYCKSQREEGKCEYYSKTRKKSGRATVEAQYFLEKLKELCPCDCEETIKKCAKERFCPYEMSTLLAENAKIIIADYYYIFNPSIRDSFFRRAKKNLSSSIIIIDEGHNLPKRIRELLTTQISNFSLSRAIKEAKKYKYRETAKYLMALQGILESFENRLGAEQDEMLVKKEELVNQVNLFHNYDEIVAHLEFVGDEIMERRKRSYVLSVAHFMDSWLGQDNAFARIFSRKRIGAIPMLSLSYRCLDPSLLTKDIIEQAYSTIIMSGTLTPTSMYKDVLGFSNVIEKEYPSPFPHKNRLNIIIPETTTKFTERSNEQYQNIAKIAAGIVNSVPGSSAIFFPSYRLRDNVNNYFQFLSEKTVFMEQSVFTKKEKQELLENFKSYRKQGAVLLGVSSGSFAQGIDIPGNILKAVIVAGLPLEKPDLEIQELIDYYQQKFGKGVDYGYIFPAIIKCLQSAGRCIRSETDRGVIVFLDRRFAWNNYLKCFPADWEIKITTSYLEQVKEFFKNQ